jgi:hypothetical protein
LTFCEKDGYEKIHSFDKLISPQLLLYRICTVFGLPTIDNDEYESAWDLYLVRFGEGQTRLRLYDYGGQRVWASMGLKKEVLRLSSY